MTIEKEIEKLREEIDTEMESIRTKLLKHSNNQEIYLKNLKLSLSLIKWINKKINLSRKSAKYTVSQKEIFYCELGINIGSEQDDLRPVVILQNNSGNISSTTTIVAPITTHNSSVQYDNEKNKYYIEIIKDGETNRKYLGYYEVPLEIEEGSINGFINIAQIRVIDRKRITQSKSAIITEQCLRKIKKAVDINLRNS